MFKSGIVEATMTKFMTALILLLAMPLSLWADVTKEELRKLCAAGISDSTILTFVRANMPLGTLTASDLVDLRREGASDPLLSSLLDLATGTAVPSEESAPVPAVSEVYSDPSSDQLRTCSDPPSSAGDSCLLAAPAWGLPSFGLGLDLCAGLSSGCYDGIHGYRGHDRYGGTYNHYRGYSVYSSRPHPAPFSRGGTFAGSFGGVGATGTRFGGRRGGTAIGPFRGSRPSVGSVHTFSGGSHFGGGGHSSGGGGHSSGGHGGGGHGGHR